MGVHGLWELLSPVGRRVSVETLAGKRLAIDASIWMVQFMKAMRDERGEMVRNAHLLGFFRRICKLLYLRTKPVFVFDGGTPALKRRTLIARRRQRDNAQAKVRKTAEKLLLNHLRAMKLREIAKDLESQRQKQKQKGDAKRNRILPGLTKSTECSSETKEAIAKSYSQEKLDEMMRIFTEAEEKKISTDDALPSAASSPCEANSDEDEDANIILQSIDCEVDPDVVAALPLSVQRKLVQKYKSDAKGKKIVSDPTSVRSDSVRSTEKTWQENTDEMLAASLVAEEEQNVTARVSGAANINLDIEDQDYEDEEMIMPEMHGEVDPSILAALPPSMQLDLLVQMREKLMAENRQKYKKVKKDPAKFSELQIQAYLKTVAFRREINEVQKTASGSGVSGVHTSRIASEANREFIFSSSFTGDKQVLVSARAGRNGDKLQQESRQASNSLDKSKSTQSNTMNRSTTSDKSTMVFCDSETYLDERGRVRVSRVRGMGMRMTRDLQRNLDLMKEIESERENGKKIVNAESMKNSEIGGSEKLASENQNVGISVEGNSEFDTLNEGTGKNIDGSVSIKKTQTDGLESFPSEKHSVEVLHEDIVEFESLNDEIGQTVAKHDAFIEISFEGNGDKSFDGDDDLFASLVSEVPVKDPTLHHESGTKSSDCSLDFDSEDGIIGRGSDPKLDSRSDFREGIVSDDSEIDWEEGERSTISCQDESVKAVSIGSLEEEADLQEAMKRSLEDYHVVSENDNPKSFVGNDSQGIGALILDANSDKLEQADVINTMYCAQIIAVPGGNGETESEKRHPDKELQCSESVSKMGTKEIHMVAEQPLDDFDEDCQISRLPNKCLGEILFTSVSNLEDDGKTHFEAECSNSVARTKADILQVESSPEKLTDDIFVKEKLAAGKNHQDLFDKETDSAGPIRVNIDEAEVDIMEAKLEEEIIILDQERLNLGNEQRKFERDAESVSSEMFVECQELLQMFGLPYIIAPMEAEAQCAYMELENLVDGVVTDDSDVFLFGARSVYKNIFDDRKYVETYFMKDIENELGLAREKLIRMALLLGSDYTEGVSGIGIVNAIEVVNAFPEEDGLHKFREWIESPDPTILGKLGTRAESSQRKRGSKAGEEDSALQNNLQAQNHNQSADLVEEREIFMNKHRNVSKNWHIPLTFPSNEVFSAYFNPQVDKSTEPFSWGKPDHLFLRKLCWEKFGWDNKKADELVLPVLKEYSKRETQLRMEAFYTFNEKFAKIRSKRIKKVVKGITGNSSALLINDVVQDASKTRKKRTNPIEEQGGGLNERDFVENTSHKARKRHHGKAAQVSVKDSKLSMEEDSNRGKRGRKMNGEDDFGIRKVDKEMLNEPQDMRRSTRQKKSVNYSEAYDDMDQPIDQEDERHSDKEAKKVEVSNEDALAGGNEHKEHNLENPPLEETSGQDLESGLCPIEDENREHYLKMGGGFCINEDDDQSINKNDAGQATGSMTDNLDSIPAFGSLDEGICRGSIDESSKASETMEGNVEIDDFYSGRPLRAMPYLRKKRRKSNF